MSFQGTRVDLTHAPSVMFPTSVSDVLATNDFDSIFYSFIDAFVPLLAASAGAISIEWDYLGDGESSDYPRSYLTKNPVETASVVVWLAAQRYVKEATQGCTTLRNQAVTTGYSLGGVTALWAATTLGKFGVEITRVFSQAAPYDPNLVVWSGFSEDSGNIFFGRHHLPGTIRVLRHLPLGILFKRDPVLEQYRDGSKDS